MNKKDKQEKPGFKNKIELLINEILFLRKENELLREQLELYVSRLENPGKYFSLLKSELDKDIKGIPAGNNSVLKRISKKSDLNLNDNPDIKITDLHSGNAKEKGKIEEAEFENYSLKNKSGKSNEKLFASSKLNEIQSGHYNKDENKIVNVEIINADFELPDEESNAYNAEKYDGEAVSAEVDFLRNRIDEYLKSSFRKKYNKTIRSRWINELLHFQNKGRTTTEEILSELKIPATTLKRDIKLFKSKGWIEYTGNRKNGFYRITKEGRSIPGNENS